MGLESWKGAKRLHAVATKSQKRSVVVSPRALCLLGEKQQARSALLSSLKQSPTETGSSQGYSGSVAWRMGGSVDTESRYIYIHGTPEEDRIGQPASHGCIRMLNDDVI